MKGSIMPALSGRMKSPRRLTTKSDPGAGLRCSSLHCAWAIHSGNNATITLNSKNQIYNPPSFQRPMILCSFINH
jgi:hypothetical protein